MTKELTVKMLIDYASFWLMVHLQGVQTVTSRVLKLHKFPFNLDWMQAIDFSVFL